MQLCLKDIVALYHSDYAEVKDTVVLYRYNYVQVKTWLYAVTAIMLK